MESTKSNDRQTENERPSEFPAIASLRLTAEEIDALADQGFVCEEKRGRRTYYKLRFRLNGRQSVRYIGNCSRAASVRNELLQLQAEARVMRVLKARIQIAGQMIRRSKQILEPVIQEMGLVFHGLAIRHPRGSKKA